jgi:hypothetical protein
MEEVAATFQALGAPGYDRRAMARKRRTRKPRERLGHERPGSVLRGPPISLTCECGAKKDLAYGEEWRCESCGRRWDTTRIPREDYDAIRRTQLRFRILPVALGLLVLGLAVFFTLTGNVFSVFFLLPVALMSWFMLIRPVHRKRYRRAVADLPKWELKAER